MRRKSLQPAKPSSEPEVVAPDEDAPLPANIVIYKKARGSKESDIGDTNLIEVGDAVSYSDKDSHAQMTGRVEKVNVQAGVLRTAPSLYGKYVMRHGKKLAFSEIVAVTRKRILEQPSDDVPVE